MAGLEISKNDVYETGLKYDYVKEKLENHKDLKDLYGQVIGLGEKENKKIEDLSGLKNYLNSIKDKNFDEIKQEGATLSFAVQLFLKSQNLYDGKIDGLYMTAGQPDSKTRQAVREFQKQQGFTGKDLDGWAGTNTIQKMIEALDKSMEQPETDKEKFRIALKDILKKTGEQEQRLFREGKGEITDGAYTYIINDGKLIRHIGEESKEIFVSNNNRVKYEGSNLSLSKKQTNQQNITENKSPEGDDDKKEEIKFTGSVDSRKTGDMMEYIEEKYKYKNDALPYIFDSNNFNFLKKEFLETNKTELGKDPIVNAYMLYKAMKGIGTNKNLVQRCFDNYKGEWNVLEKTFGTPDDESLVSRLDSDYSDKGFVKLFQHR